MSHRRYPFLRLSSTDVYICKNQETRRVTYRSLRVKIRSSYSQTFIVSNVQIVRQRFRYRSQTGRSVWELFCLLSVHQHERKEYYADAENRICIRIRR